MPDERTIEKSRPSPLLVLDGVRYGFRNRPDFLGPIGLTVRQGDCWAIVGPNGAGKTTLMRLLAGLAPPSVGSLRVSTSSNLTARDRARIIAYLPQHLHVTGRLTAYEIVMLGRYPHRGAGFFETEHDEEIVVRAMAMTDTTALAHREIGTLSGGEQQRVHLAAALAQQPQWLLLDEPTASLDLKHQLSTFELLHDLAVRSRLGVIVATHDLNLAVRFCTNVLVLNDGKVISQGVPAEVCRPETLGPVYGVRMLALSSGDRCDAPRGGDGKELRWLVAVERTDGLQA